MYQFNIKIAEHTIRVETVHVRSMALCRPFFTEEAPEFCIRTDQADIDHARCAFEDLYGETTLWDGFMETYALHAKLSEKLLDYEIFLIHGAAVAHAGAAYLFSADSGTGKTTHVRKWRKYLTDAFVVNGDKPYVLAGDDSTPMVYGSPWAGKENMYKNTGVPLRAIVLMERAEKNSIQRISFSEAFLGLLKQVYLPDDPEKMRETLKLLKSLDGRIGFYRFECNNFRDDNFIVSYKALCGEESL